MGSSVTGRTISATRHSVQGRPPWQSGRLILAMTLCMGIMAVPPLYATHTEAACGGSDRMAPAAPRVSNRAFEAALRFVLPPGSKERGTIQLRVKSGRLPLERISVRWEETEGLSFPDGTRSLSQDVEKPACGREYVFALDFVPERMGFHRIKAKVVASTEDDIVVETLSAVFEAGEDRGYYPAVKPFNRWQNYVTNLASGATAYAVDERCPPLPSMGRISIEAFFDRPPMLGRRVRLRGSIRFDEELAGDDDAVEVVILFPPKSFDVDEAEFGLRGHSRTLADGVGWMGSLPQGGRGCELPFELLVRCNNCGEGDVRILVKGRSPEGKLYTRESRLHVQVNEHSCVVGR